MFHTSLLGLTALIVGCELLVDGRLGVVHCDAEGALGPPACPAGLQCVQGTCVSPPPSQPPLGSACTQDADCAPFALCVEPAAWGGTGPRVCSRACCTSADCDDEGQSGSVCWIPDAGGRSYCRPAAVAGRSAPGEAGAGLPCTTGSDCRSGLCSGSVCVDACCSDTNCAAAGASCRFGATPAATHAAWSCAPTPEAGRGPFDPCMSDQDCASGLCVELPGVIGLACATPCCSSDQCGGATLGGVTYLFACVAVERGGLTVHACAGVVPETATAAVGVECEKNEECRGGACIQQAALGGKRICTDACCNDASCGDPAFACRPVPTSAGQPWDLRCELR